MQRRSKKTNRVRYVVGDCFGQPVVVEHVVPERELTPAELGVTNVPMPPAAKSSKSGKNKAKHLGKRTCGQSQYSARDAQKQRMADKK